MKWLTLIIGLLTLAALTGCTSMTVNHDYDREVDFRTYKTYKWIDEDKDPRITKLTDKRIRTAVEYELDKKKYVKTEGMADFLVTYKAFARDRVDVYTHSYGYWHGYGRGTYVDVDRYQEGTLVLDIVDPRMQQMIWRGWAVSVVGDPSQQDRKIKEAANKILKRFPPK